MRSYLIFILITSALFLDVNFVYSQDFYVSTAGNDANNGLSEATAWRHVNKAAQTLSAGQTAIILDGIYKERVQIANSGTRDHPITIRAKNKRMAVIDGTGISISGSSAGLFQITSRKHIDKSFKIEKPYCQIYCYGV